MMTDFGDEFISLELIFMGILSGNDKASTLLKNQGATLEKLKSSYYRIEKREERNRSKYGKSV